MPSSRPCAAFEPISPDFDLKALVESTPNFEWVVRIHCDMIDHQGLENFEKLVLIHVILGGKPLVIEGYDFRLDRWTFALQWLRDNCGSKVEHARDLTKKTNVPLTIGHYLNNMALLTNQWTPRNYKDPERQRMYLKDIDCPPLWHDKLSEIVPPGLYYLNESTGDIGGFGAVDENDPTRPGTRRGRGIAKAGDLMSSLPKEMRAENMMCYIGHEGTYTPAHREMCASLGQNIMVEASTGMVEDGKMTKPGSSIWFMTESKERAVVSEYWLSKLGHDIEIENHFAQINAWKNAPFKTYVVEQKPGDFILIPPLAPHQVWNRGTRTMKVAWNRTTVETLEMAMREALPRARMVCRDEQYKNKAIVYYTMQKYSKSLKAAEKVKQKSAGSKPKSGNDTKVRQLEKDFRRLHHLYTEILISEHFLPGRPERKVEMLPYDGNVTCSYCRCNIFNRFLTCPSCVGDLGNGEEDTYDICMECYAMGRSCACISKLKWVEQWSWNDLTQKHEQWRHQILEYEGKVTERSPVSIKTELDRLGNKRTLAQICQLELARRPFRDFRRPPSPVTGDDRIEEDEVDANGNVKKKRKIVRSDAFIRKHARCHVDMHWEPKWKQASCSSCDKNYCYGVLFRAYDMMPRDIMADPDWKCPSCRNICGCRNCRKKPEYKAYIPAGTALGHDTKAVADPRSVENLVDFSQSNIGWIQKAGDDGDDTRRLKKRRKEADVAKASEPKLGEDYVDGDDANDGIEDGILRLAEHEGIPVDPALGAGPVLFDNSPEAEDEYDEHPEGARPDGDSTPGDIPWVPEGGVIRDYQHAYDPTEAITYDYPDPEIGRNLAAAVEEDTADAVPEGYEPAVADEPAEIEMVDRKRKRGRLDNGERSYKSKKPATEKAKKQQRKSLIVKLPVNSDRLTGVDQMANVARQALNGVPEVPAPVISSDLQALNAAADNPQQVPKRTRGVEHIVVDRDDDFTPGRHRDRRRALVDGAPRSPPDAEITRRQTRMQQTHYEEPSEEEFDEVLPEPSERPKSSKVVRLDETEFHFDDSESEVSDAAQDGQDESSASSPPVEMAVDPSLKPTAIPVKLTAMPVKPIVARKVTESFDGVSERSTRSPTISSIEAPPPKRPTAGKAPALTVSKPSSKSLEEAQANRRAKMAAIEMIENDTDDFDDVWSQDSFLDESTTAPKQAGPPPQPAVKPVIQNGQKAIPSAPPASKPVATTAAWVDSDDSDDEPPARRPGQSQGFTSVNKPAARKADAPKKRGRPPKSSV
ncbi:hypothetical protein EDD36DRAFT_492897 [Exophiala viscosa]|uniref:JmjC domain-containing protein n=1 Tax=Exophiala viscosa TaxID=2486360 RepID=A0AAN6IG85_9EURO|nr:hypothetical protein EDD36DRAFT_492897 [Exophiala viscosa]